MKFPTLCAVVSTLASSVRAIASNTISVRGPHTVSLLEKLNRHRDPAQDHDIGPMLKSAESMLMDLASNHKAEPLADLVGAIRPLIVRMQESINASHNTAQQTLSTFGSGFAGCNAAKAEGEGQATNLENMKTNFSTHHKSCRTRQKAADDQHAGCQSAMNALQDAKDASCRLYQDAERTPGCEDLPANTGETWESYVTRAAIWFPQQRDDYLQKKAVCNNDTEKLEAQKVICSGTDGSGGQKKVLEDTKQECDNIQNQLESATCSYVSKIKATCESFGTCTNTLADAFDNQRAGIEALEHQRKVEWNATERLLCLLGVYGASGDVNATKLQTCQHMADKTSHLNLNYPSPTPRPNPCADLLPHPCGSAYTQAEYGDLDAPAGTCTACSFGGGSGGPPSPPGGPPLPQPTEEVSSFQQLRLCLHQNNSVCSLTDHIRVEQSSNHRCGPTLCAGAANRGLSLPFHHFATILGNGFSLDGQGLHQIIKVMHASLTAHEVVFKNGHAKGYPNHAGGAVRVTGWNQQNYDGTAAMRMPSNTHHFSCFKCQFLDNQAEQKGGAIFSMWGGIHLEDVLFRGNQITECGGGGALVATYSPLSCKNCQFIDNDAGMGCEKTLNNFKIGGAILAFNRCWRFMAHTGYKTGVLGDLSYHDVYGMDLVEGCQPYQLINVHFSGNQALRGNDIFDPYNNGQDGGQIFGDASATTTCPGASTQFDPAECSSSTKKENSGQCTADAVNCASYDLDSSWVQAAPDPWSMHAGTNCFQGYGATNVPIVGANFESHCRTPVASADDCKALCLQSDGCEAVVYWSDHSGTYCCARKDVALAHCVAADSAVYIHQ